MVFDLVFKEKSQSMCFRNQMFLNINFLLFIENIIFRSLLTIIFYTFVFKFLGFLQFFLIFPD